MSYGAAEWDGASRGEAAHGLMLPLWPSLGLMLLVGALFLRVGALDAVPLAPDEAGRALQARAIVRGWAVDYGGAPLLINLMAVSMGLFTVANGPTRLPTVLAGWAVCLTPLLFRGRVGWLAAASACGL